MKGIIRELSEMTDSREMMEAKTNPAITIFISVLLILLAAAFAWSFFGEIDEVAKASGVVRPNEKVSTIQASLTGQIERVLVQEGIQVTKGMELITLDRQELEMELTNREAEIEEIHKELEYLELYKKSIQSLENRFSSDRPDEEFYYDLVEQFLLEYRQRELDYQSAGQQIGSSKTEIAQSRESITVNIQSSERKRQEEIESLERKMEILSAELEHEKQLKQSMESGENVISPSDTKRMAQFESYLIRLEQLENTVNERKATYERSAGLGDRFVPKAQIEEEQRLYEAVQLQLEQYRQEAVLGVESNITDFEHQLRELDTNLAKLQEPESSIVSERESLELQQSHLSDKHRELLKQEEMNIRSKETVLRKFKLDRIVQIHMSIDDRKKRLDSLGENVEQLQTALEKRTLKSPISGTVNVLKEMNSGGIVQPGESLLAIIPTNESKYKMSIAVPNHEIGKISLGDKVELNFHAFPKQSFGSLEGTITSISTDSVVQQDGRSYYMVEASIASDPLIDRRGERGEIRVGMTADAYVITGSKKIIHYLLEKINLKE